MSATKHMKKQVKMATFDELTNWENQIQLALESERNMMKRSSLMQQLQIVRGEQKIRIDMQSKQ